MQQDNTPAPHLTASVSPQEMEALFRYHYRTLALYSLRYVENLDAAEDIVQECFADLWEQIVAGHRSIKDGKSYLFKMVRNRSLDYLKRISQHDHHPINPDTDHPDAETEAQEDAELSARLWTAIDTLPERCREVFLMNKRDGMKYQEVADALGISVNTVENQVRKALKHLRDRAEQIYHFLLSL